MPYVQKCTAIDSRVWRPNTRATSVSHLCCGSTQLPQNFSSAVPNSPIPTRLVPACVCGISGELASESSGISYGAQHSSCQQTQRRQSKTFREQNVRYECASPFRVLKICSVDLIEATESTRTPLNMERRARKEIEAKTSIHYFVGKEINRRPRNTRTELN